MEPHEAYRRGPRSAAPRRKAAGQDRGATGCDQAHARVGPLILPRTDCRLYYRLISNSMEGGKHGSRHSTLAAWCANSDHHYTGPYLALGGPQRWRLSLKPLSPPAVVEDQNAAASAVSWAAVIA